MLARIVTREQAEAYVDEVNSSNDFQACVYGHLHCALVDGGPCCNEISIRFRLDDGEVL